MRKKKRTRGNKKKREFVYFFFFFLFNKLKEIFWRKRGEDDNFKGKEE
jgi:hypothetical protein